MPWRFGKSRIFLFFCLAFVAGVALGRFFTPWIMAFAAMIFLMLISVWWADKRFVLAGFLGLMVLLGAWRYQASLLHDEENFIGNYYGQDLQLEAVIIKDPDVRSDKTNLTVRPIAPSPQPSPARGEGESLVGNVLLNIGKYPEYAYGDKLKISGELEEPFETEEFSYKNYLSRYDTYAVMRFPQIEKLATGEGNKITAALLAFKHKCQAILTQSLPEPASSLILGILLGLKRGLPEDLKNAMVAVGVSHIIVISGYNMSVITRNITQLRNRNWVGRRAVFALSLLLVLAFVVMTGADASVVRAAIMAMMTVLALNLGRIYQSLNALVLVAAVMVFQNPKILGFDIGFQLSFMATAGLVFLGDIFQKKFTAIPELGLLQLRSNLSSTLAAQIFTLPLLIYYFDRLSLISPVVNVLILWTVPPAMALGLAVIILGLVYLPLAKIAAVLLWAVLWFEIAVVRFFAQLPLASISVSVSAALVIIYYLILAGWLYRRKKLMIS